MKSFFDPCVDKSVELIRWHVGEVDRQPGRRKVRVSSGAPSILGFKNLH